MSFLNNSFDKRRQVIPRWHTYSIARWLGLTNSIKQKLPIKKNEDFQEKVRAWVTRAFDSPTQVLFSV